MPAMKSYLYSSPAVQPFSGNDDYGSPRVPTGRRPVMNFNRRSTPNGEYTNENYSNVPFSPPQPLPMNTASVNMGFDQPVSMPLEQAMRMRNQGNIARGPSPQFAASKQGMQRFSSYGESGQANATPNFGTTTGGTVAPGGTPGMAGAANPKMDLKRYNAMLAGARALHAAGDDEGAQHLTNDAMKILNPPAPATQPSAPIFGESNPSLASQPFAGKANPPTPTLPMSGPEYQARLAGAYQTAATDLDKNPQLGTTMPQHTPLPPLTPPPSGMGNSPSDYRMASEQAYRNQTSIARVNQAGDDKVNDANAAQVKQNRAASANIGRKGQQFDLAKQAAPTKQPSQTVQAAAPAPQPAQQASASEPKQWNVIDPQTATANGYQIHSGYYFAPGQDGQMHKVGRVQ